MVPAKGKALRAWQDTLAISPLDCMGCGVCVNVCPSDLRCNGNPTESLLAQQDVFDYCVDNVSDKPALDGCTGQGHQFKQPVLEFSGACAGCAERRTPSWSPSWSGESHVRRERHGLLVHLGGPAATARRIRERRGRGPAWSNSLFEDNAEHGLGCCWVTRRCVTAWSASWKPWQLTSKTPAETRIYRGYLDTMAEWRRRKRQGRRALVPALEAAAENGCPERPEILQNKEYLNKKSVWIFGGDGWPTTSVTAARPRLASGEDVTVFVFGHEVYSNTAVSFEGNQHRPGRPVRGPRQDVKKKSLTENRDGVTATCTWRRLPWRQAAQTIKPRRGERIPDRRDHRYSPCEMHSSKAAWRTARTR